jgi:hypothetical protein
MPPRTLGKTARAAADARQIKIKGRNAMKLSRIQGHGRLLRRLGAFAVALLLASCAGAPPSPPQADTNKMLAAGFKIVAAKTPDQQMHVKALAPGRFTELQRTGKHFFVYPDPANSRVYVGTPKEYQAYLGADPGYGAALSRQQAGDLAAYNRQDAAMANYTNRDYNDPYYFWPTYEGLWQPVP